MPRRGAGSSRASHSPPRRTIRRHARPHSTTSRSPCAPRASSEQALEFTEEALALCVAVGDRHREAALENNAADLFQALGRPDEAMERLKLAVATFAEIGEDAAAEPEIWKLVEW